MPRALSLAQFWIKMTPLGDSAFGSHRRKQVLTGPSREADVAPECAHQERSAGAGRTAPQLLYRTGCDHRESHHRESPPPEVECWPAIARRRTRRSSSRRGQVYPPATVSYKPPAVKRPNRRVQGGLMRSGGRLRWETARRAHDADVGRDTPFARWHRPGSRVWGARPRAAARWQTPRLSLGRRGRLGHDVSGCVAAGDVRLPSDDGTQLPPTNAHGMGPDTVDRLPRHK